MHRKWLYFAQLLLLLLVVAAYASASVSVSVAAAEPSHRWNYGGGNVAVTAASNVPKVRMKRGIFWDFFQKVVTTKNLIVDQYVDTKNSLNEVYNMLNEGFSDPAPRKPTLPTSSTEKPSSSSEDEERSSEMTSTTEKYSITRYELGRILGRNFRGLQRLAKIEFKDALNATNYNLQEYKAESKKQFANSVAVETKNKFDSLKG